MDRLNAMKVFTRVVEAQSFAKAAATLALPRSNVTRLVKDLETYLGVRLIHRTTRQLKLTAEGEAYYGRCVAILAEIEAAEAALAVRAASPSGRLRVDMPPSMARLCLLPNLTGFQSIYPDLDLTLTLTDRLVDLVREGVDCAVRAGDLEDVSGLVARRIGAYGWMVCAAPAYLDRFGEPRTLDDLQHARAVGYLSSRTGRPTGWRFVDGEEERLVAAPSSLIVDDTDAYVAAGLEGLGLIRIASYIARPYLADGRLRHVLTDLKSPKAPLSMIFPAGRPPGPGARVFMVWFARILAEATAD